MVELTTEKKLFAVTLYSQRQSSEAIYYIFLSDRVTNWSPSGEATAWHNVRKYTDSIHLKIFGIWQITTMDGL